jgi:hypothetical protein
MANTGKDTHLVNAAREGRRTLVTAVAAASATLSDCHWWQVLLFKHLLHLYECIYTVVPVHMSCSELAQPVLHGALKAPCKGSVIYELNGC